VSYETAAELLRKARGSVKTAIVMSRLSLDYDGAVARLSAAGGRVSKALQE